MAQGRDKTGEARVAVDARLAPLVEGCVPIERGTTLPLLRKVAVLVLEGGDAWDRLRLMRLGGVRGSAILVTQAVEPLDRLRLEPVSVLPGPHEVMGAVVAAQRPREEGTVVMATGVLDRDRARFLRADGQEIALTTLEARLLAYLSTRPGRAVDREELQRQVWEHRAAVPTKTVDMTVARLRKKIELDPAHPTTLLTVRNGGYRVVPGPVGPAAEPLAPGGALLGRDLVLQHLSALVQRTSVALVGPPGVGKSRVASELARRLGSAARLVDLDGSEGLPLATALATAAHAPAVGDPLVGLVRALAGVTVLVVDHADDHADELAVTVRVLAEAGIRVLAVLRRAPTLPGVVVHELVPLSPAEAVLLLDDRSGQPVERRVAERIVARLDHLPLAIELAAARLPGLGAEAMLELLEHEGASWLTGAQGAHHSVAEAIEWSWRRLGPEEQRALAALTLYRSPFSRADALELGVEGPALAELIAHHLVIRDGARLRVLHAVRDHALASLALTAEARDRYVRHVRALTRSALARIDGFEGRDAWSELSSRAADLAAAYRMASAPAQVVDLATALDRLRLQSGTARDRMVLAEETLARCAADPAAHAQALLARSRLEPQPAVALEWVARALACGATDWDLQVRLRFAEARLLAVTQGPKRALDAFRSIELMDTTPVWRLCAEAERIHQEVHLGLRGHRDSSEALVGVVEELVAHDALLTAADVGLGLGFHWTRSDPERAVSLLARLSTWVGAVSDTTRRIELALPLSEGLVMLGSTREAEAVLDEAEALAVRVLPSHAVRVRIHRGDLAASTGRFDEARRHHEEVLATMRRRDNALRVYGALEALAIVECESGHPKRAEDRAAEAVRVAQRSDNPHLVHHAHLLVALVAGCHGDGRAAAEALAGLDATHLSDLGVVQWVFVRVVASLLQGGTDSDAWSRLDRLPDTLPAARWRARVLELVTAGRASDRETLARCMRPDAETNPELRLLARLWLAVAGAGPRSAEPGAERLVEEEPRGVSDRASEPRSR